MRYLPRGHWFWSLALATVLLTLFVAWRFAAGRERAVTIWGVPLANTVRITQHEFAGWASSQQATADRLTGFSSGVRDGSEGDATGLSVAGRWLVALGEVAFVGTETNGGVLTVVACSPARLRCQDLGPDNDGPAVEQRLVRDGLLVFRGASFAAGRRAFVASDPTARLFPQIANWSLGAPGRASEFLLPVGDSVVSVTVDSTGAVRPRRLALAGLRPLQREALASNGFRRGHDALGRPVLAVADTSPLRGWRILRAIGEDEVPAAVASQAISETLLSLAIVGLLVGLIAWSRHREAQERTGRLATAARLDALRAQLRPHFLFNALNTVAEFVHEDPERADAMLVRLAGLLHLSLSETDGPVVTLRREMELLEAYLDIERLRFRDTLVVETAIPASLADAIVPSWLLQPVVENAIKFGTNARGGVTRVSVTAQERGSQLVIAVTDPGERPDSASAGTASHRRGLSNVRERLTMLFGDDAYVRVEPGHESRGTQVEIGLPLRLAKVAGQLFVRSEQRSSP